MDGTLGNCSTATACYSYDARGARAEKITSAGKIDYVRDLSGNVAVEWDTALNGYTGWGSGYIYTNGQLLAEYENGTTYFIHKDHLGDTRVMTGVNGSTFDSMDYLPYGEQIAGGSGTTHKFTGKERDAESGLDDFDARYYSSNLGRFVSADWSATPVPVPYADFSDPQSLNLYSYVRNLPTVRVDANGHCDGAVACVQAVAWFVNNFSLTDIAKGAGKQLATNASENWGIKPSGSLEASNDMQRIGGELFTGATQVAAVVLPFVGGEEGGVGPKEGESGGAGAGKPGEVYKTEPQESGKPYVGRTTQGVDNRMATRTDGRTGKATTVDTYKSTQEGQYKEQKAIDQHGGVKNLDNKRNEVSPKRMKELQKKYDQK